MSCCSGPGRLAANRTVTANTLQHSGPLARPIRSAHMADKARTFGKGGRSSWRSSSRWPWASYGGTVFLGLRQPAARQRGRRPSRPIHARLPGPTATTTPASWPASGLEAATAANQRDWAQWIELEQPVLRHPPGQAVHPAPETALGHGKGQPGHVDRPGHHAAQAGQPRRRWTPARPPWPSTPPRERPVQHGRGATRDAGDRPGAAATAGQAGGGQPERQDPGPPAVRHHWPS